MGVREVVVKVGEAEGGFAAIGNAEGGLTMVEVGGEEEEGEAATAPVPVPATILFFFFIIFFTIFRVSSPAILLVGLVAAAAEEEGEEEEPPPAAVERGAGARSGVARETELPSVLYPRTDSIKVPDIIVETKEKDGNPEEEVEAEASPAAILSLLILVPATGREVIPASSTDVAATATAADVQRCFVCRNHTRDRIYCIDKCSCVFFFSPSPWCI